jgi:ribosomal protein S1
LKPKKRSSRLTKQEFGDFVDFVVRKFAENGIVLELPGEQAA